MPAIRPCLELGCREYAIPGGSRCPAHHRAFEKQRWDQGATGRRGSRAGWRELRKRAYRVQKGRCARCGGWLAPGWELHHRNGDARDNAPSNLEAVHPDCHPK